MRCSCHPSLSPRQQFSGDLGLPGAVLFTEGDGHGGELALPDD